MTSDYILCGELNSEFIREYGFFTSAISGASGVLKGYIFSEFRKLSAINEELLKDLSELIRITDIIIDSTTNVINSTAYSIEKELGKVYTDYSFTSFLNNIGINPVSFNPFNNLKDSVSTPIENYIKSLLIDYPANLLVTYLSNLETSVSKDHLIKLFNMKYKIQEKCPNISLPSDSEIRTYMESVALNLNCEFNIFSNVITQKFKFNTNKINYILNLLTIGRKLKTIKSKLMIGN